MPPWTTYPGPNDARPSRTLAVVAFVLAIIPLGITTVAAVVLAAMVLVEVPARKARGKGLAIAALVISWLWLSLMVAVVLAVLLDSSPPHAQVRDASPAETRVAAVRLGDCLLRIPTEDPVSTLKIVSCSTPHRGEVYARFDVASGSESTQVQIDRRTERGCRSRFTGFVGRDYNASKLEFVYMPPLASSIDDNGGAICILMDGEEVTLGTLKGAKR